MSYPDYLFKSLDYDVEKPLLMDAANPARNISAADVKTMISKLVAGFKHYGLKKGDSVCVMALNDIFYTPLYLGIMAAGGIFTGANPGYTSFEIEHQLRNCKVQFMVASPSSLDVARKAAAAVGLPPQRLFVFNPRHDDIPFESQSWWSLMKHGEASWVPVADPAKEPACYINSSGTSGLPKAVVVPHKYLENQVTGLVERNLPYKVSRLICIPPFSGYNVPSQHGAPIKAGECVYVMPRYEIKSFLSAVKQFKITETLLLPPILLDLPHSPHVRGDPDALQSLRQIFCGGAAIGKGVQSRMYGILHPDARIAQIYGMTEVGWTCGSLYPEKDETGSVGRPLKSYQIKIVDDNEVVITEPNVDGEIFINAAYPMLGYLNNEDATKAAFASGGWIRSGDVGHVKTNGLYYITDRKKDLIKIRGWQVSPAELEEVILMHPELKDAAVIGCKLPAPSTEEVVHAYVVRKEGSNLTAEGVKQFMRLRLARFKVAEEVYFIDSVPRNPTGKVMRRILRPQYLEFTRRKSEHELLQTFLKEKPVMDELKHGDGMDTQIVMTPPAATPRAEQVDIIAATLDATMGKGSKRGAQIGPRLLSDHFEDQTVSIGRRKVSVSNKRNAKDVESDDDSSGSPTFVAPNKKSKCRRCGKVVSGQESKEKMKGHLFEDSEEKENGPAGQTLFDSAVFV